MYSLRSWFFGFNTSPVARPLRTGLIFAALLCFAPYWALAVSPAPDGGYTNGNIAEGTDALFSFTTGTDNTPIGNFALHNTTTGSGTMYNPRSLLHILRNLGRNFA
jgi:hypothetical protein